MVTGLRAASMEKEGAKVERNAHIAENAGVIAIGLLAVDTAARAAPGKAEKNVHLAGESAEIMVTGPGLLAVDIVKEAGPGKAESAEDIMTGLLVEASMEREGAKAEKGAPLVEANAEIMVTGPGLQAVDTAEIGAEGAHLAERNAHSAEGNAAEAASASGTRRGGKAEASAKEALLERKGAQEGLTAQSSCRGRGRRLPKCSGAGTCTLRCFPIASKRKSALRISSGKGSRRFTGSISLN
jgi:hypothetical protein